MRERLLRWGPEQCWDREREGLRVLPPLRPLRVRAKGDVILQNCTPAARPQFDDLSESAVVRLSPVVYTWPLFST